MTNTKGNPGAVNAGATGRTDRDKWSYSTPSIHQKTDLVKPNIVRQTAWQILGPMIRTARRLGLVGLVDDLLELGRSWQRRGVAA